MPATLYLIPTVLYEGATDPLPPYLLDHVKKCKVLFVENERTSRRFLKLLDRSIQIEDFEWHAISEMTEDVKTAFTKHARNQQTMGVMSEAGCPGIADPGQHLVAMAQQLGVIVKPLSGPNSILLALMASGMNGQHFRFRGYLPIAQDERVRAIRQMESESRQQSCTQVCIETPYRNNQLMEQLIKACGPETRICVAVDLTGPGESVVTKKAREWKSYMPELHKRPAIFLLDAS